MTRLKTIPLAVAAIVVSAGAVLGFAALPAASGPGLDGAGEAAGRSLPARPESNDAPDAAPAADPEANDAPDVPEAADLPDAASHGAAVSTVATGEDPTPDTNKGADVSAVARDNHGQTVAGAHKPDAAGKPADAGKPDDTGKPDRAGRP